MKVKVHQKIARVSARLIWRKYQFKNRLLSITGAPSIIRILFYKESKNEMIYKRSKYLWSDFNEKP